MAGRAFLFHLFRRTAAGFSPTLAVFSTTLRHAGLLALAAMGVAVISALGLRHVLAERSPRGIGNTALVSGTESRVIGEFEGSFDPQSRRMEIHEASAGTISSPSLRRLTLQARNDANTDIPTGSFSWSLAHTAGAPRDSIFLSSGELAGTWSSEIQITNNTAYTFYNTRLIFTTFRLGSASGGAATNSPMTGGLAYYNDGQIAYKGKLGVSRNYGDVAPGTTNKAVWTAAVPTSGPTFYFRFEIVADLGVAAESVEPAAVQINASTGSSVLIHGRGFTGTPGVELLNSSGASVANLSVTSASSTDLAVNLPANIAAGIYSLRVTNPGGTAGGVGSSTINGRLTVTGQPDAAHSLFGGISALSDTGPYLIQSNSTILSDTTILPGTVFYLASGATLQIAAGANVTANGGIPGVPNGASVSAPKQIVLTAQRAPGGAIPNAGAWGGIDATSASTAKMILRNCVLEYGGVAGSANMTFTGSGRTLQFTDSISRKSAGSGILALGVNDSLSNFTRSRIESNGSSSADAGVLLSGNAALGLYDLDGTASSTSVSDPNFYFSSANVFTGNTSNVVRIGVDAQANSNDFTKSGVLVGQGSTPIEIRGSNANPAIVGNNSAPGAELSIGPSATLQLAAGLDLQAGDFGRELFGGIAANGYAGVTQVPGAAFGSSQYITFDKLPGGANFGALFFSRNSAASSILNFVRVQNGGAGVLGQAQVIADGVAIRAKNSLINNSASGGVLQTNGGSFDTTNTDLSGNALTIDTIVGGVLGDGNSARTANFVTPVAVAVDPLGRGIYVSDSASPYFIRFINTSVSAVTIAGQTVAPSATRILAGGGSDFGDNVTGLQAEIGTVTGVGVSPDGKLLYFDDAYLGVVKALNLSSSSITVGSTQLATGYVSTLATGFGSELSWLTVSQATGNIYVADATSNINKIYQIDPAGNMTVVAGNGANTASMDGMPATTVPTDVPLLQPRAVEVDTAGNIYIADTGHARILKVTGGTISMLAQFTPGGGGQYPNGLAFLNGKLYVAHGNDQTIVRITGGIQTIAGAARVGCDYSSSNCGDNGAASAATFNILGSAAVPNPPLAGVKADSNGIFILDQGVFSRGRIRYLNLSASTITLAGTAIGANKIATIAGTGFPSPYDGGLATSAALSGPVGVAVDANNNLYVTESLSNRLRFVNRGATPVTIFPGTQAEQIVPASGVVTINKDAGTGSGDNTPANFGTLEMPQGVATTSQGVFIADSKKGPTVPSGTSGKRTGSIRFINTTSSTVTLFPQAVAPISVPPGQIVTVAGGGNTFDSVGGVRLLDPADVAIHPLTGDIYIADVGNKFVRKVNSQTGVITNVSGLSLAQYTGLAFDSAGRLYVVNYDSRHVLRQSAVDSTVFTQMDAGTALSKPRDVAVDGSGNAYVTDSGAQKIMRISATSGAVTVTAGTTQGFSGDPGSATTAKLDMNLVDINFKPIGTDLNLPRTDAIAISPTGEIFFVDSNNNRVRRLR